jgi:tetratricopeptide (TPR) repeat protein
MVAVLAAVGLVVVADAGVDLVGLALEGRWTRVLEEAVRRQDQVALRPDDALVAAHAARLAGHADREIAFLELASTDEDLFEVATVELADVVSRADPQRAVALAAPMMRTGRTSQLRDTAVEVVTESVELGVAPTVRDMVERQLSTLDLDHRRRLELSLARSEGSSAAARARLARLLEASPRDRVALEAADRLVGFDGLDDAERWWIARSLYMHALYDRAAPLFDGVVDSLDPRVPRWEAEFLRGRCAFRLGRFQEAAGWYVRARSRVTGGERAADLEVHLARALELAGDLEGAVEAARRAVLLRTTDDRRLFLARLRLVRGERDLAELGVSRVRSRTARDRGHLMLGLEAGARGDVEAQTTWMERVRREPWRQMAAVLLAAAELDSGEPEAALGRLTAAATDLDPFWSLEARRLVERMPSELIGRWREDRMTDLDAALTDAGQVQRLAVWATLEPDARRLGEIRSHVEALVGSPAGSAPVFDDGVARQLWLLGLEERAITWDPSGLPGRNAAEMVWSAAQLERFGRSDLALRVADRARARLASSIPLRAHLDPIRELMFPMPYPQQLSAAVEGCAVPPTLVAAVAREESRWNPGVVSVVGARGLMQLMPATAARVATSLGKGPVRADELFEPAIALRLGAAELDRLLEAFDGFRPAAIASYNAGEAQARLWLEQCGPGCDAARYVATVTFSSTRRYTADVLWAESMYEQKMAAPPEAGRKSVTVRTPSPPAGPRLGRSSARSRR